MHSLLSTSPILALFILSSFATAQTPRLMADVNKNLRSGNPGSDPDFLVAMGSHVYFAAKTAKTGLELYRCTGTPNSIELVKDIHPGTASSDPRWPVVMGKTLFFAANDGVHGHEMWRTDGTTAGTVMVKDIYAGSRGGYSPAYVAVIGDTFYFGATTAAYGTELWRSNGSASGTKMVKDIFPGTGHGGAGYLLVKGSIVYFAAARARNTVGLWRSNGTTPGTYLIKDIGYSAGMLTHFGKKIVFSGRDYSHGAEPWISDGTSAGTRMIKDIRPGSRLGSDPWPFKPVGGVMVFTAYDGTTGRELWKTDGTAAGTVLVKDILPGPGYSNPLNLIAFGGAVYFSALSGGPVGTELWKTDGTTAGTVMVKDLYPGSGSGGPQSLVQMGSHLYFSGADNKVGRELFRSDGTAAGTVLVKDIFPGASGSSPNRSNPEKLMAAGSRVFFRAHDGFHGKEMWSSDGTAAGTHLIGDLNPPTKPNTHSAEAVLLTDAHGTLYFRADAQSPIQPTGQELWKSDGTPAGTKLLADLRPGAASSGVAYITPVGDQVFFRAYHPSYGTEIGVTDGTPAGTRFIDLRPGINSSDPKALCAMNGRCYFFATNGTKKGMWVTDGTLAGTTFIKASPYVISLMVAHGNTLWAAPSDYYLWKSDGTPAGTVQLGALSGGIGEFLFLDDTCYIRGRGNRLWVSDGTVPGTKVVKTFARMLDAAVVGDTIYLSAAGANYDYELWKSDGTAAGTTLVKDIRAGVNGSAPQKLTAVGNTLFFTADDFSGKGRELWKSDGTPAGTVLVKDIHPGSPPSNPGNLVALGGRQLYFTAYTVADGVELWRSDGTAAGTKMLDVYPGKSNASPAYLQASNGKLYFIADDGVYGREVRVLDPDAFARPVGTPYYTGPRVPKLQATDPVLGSTLTISLRDSRPSTAGLLFLSTPFPAIRFAPGCYVYLHPLTLFYSTVIPVDAQGAASLKLPIPNEASLRGFTLATQVLILSKTPPFNLDFTNAVNLTHGR